MTEVLFNDKRFEIESATIDDAVGIGEAHLKSWLQTYPNDEYGVTEDWIRTEFNFLVKDGQTDSGRDNGNEFRRKLIEKNDPNTQYRVVKDEEGVIQGFMHVTKQNSEATIDAIYLTDNLKGTGVAHELMDEALDFVGSLPMHLQVVAYNERAIKFYEQYGFIRGDTDKELFHGKMPILNMHKPVEAKDEI